MDVIVGAGMMDTALCWPLQENGHSVRLVGTPLDEQIIQSIRSDGLHPKLERVIPGGVETYQAAELAHALQGAGVLVAESPAGLGEAVLAANQPVMMKEPLMKAASVLFVCMGNICRSPTAEGVFRDLVKRSGLDEAIHIDSAGTHAYHIGKSPDTRASAAAAQRGYDLSALKKAQSLHEDRLSLGTVNDWYVIARAGGQVAPSVL